MKKIMVLITLLLGYCLPSFSQGENGNGCTTASYCTKDLRTANVVGYQVLTHQRYASSTPPKDVVYVQNCCVPNPDKCPATDCQPSTDLYYNVYYPAFSQSTYLSCPLPAIVMFHSGAFSECSNYDKQPDITTVCKDLALRNFVVFDVEYRRGTIDPMKPVFNSTPPVNYTTAQQMLAIYRACQDGRGAFRSIIYRQMMEGMTGFPNDVFRIDLNNLFIGGMSAGSSIALNVAYYQQDATSAQVDAVFPGTPLVSDNSILGNIDQPSYYLDGGTATADYHSKIKGVINMWGSMFVPSAYQNNPWAFFSGNTYKPPIISFAGVQDDVFDINIQGVYFKKAGTTTMTINFNTAYGMDNVCNIGSPAYYNIPDAAKDGQNHVIANQYEIGSETIYEMLHDHFSIFSELYLDCQMEHGLDANDMDGCTVCSSNTNDYFRKATDCSACSYMSNFGTNNNNQDLTYDYLAARAAIFLQAIIDGDAVGALAPSPSINSKFVEAENFRYKGCSPTFTANNPATLNNSNCDAQH